MAADHGLISGPEAEIQLDRVRSFSERSVDILEREGLVRGRMELDDKRRMRKLRDRAGGCGDAEEQGE